jgi:hypothetical protein
LLLRLGHKLWTARAAALERAKQRYVTARRPHAFAPHDAAIYGRLLQQARRSRGLEVPGFTDAKPAAGRPRLYFRHDVDTQHCVTMLPKLVELNLAEGVESPVYIRTDMTDYDPRSLVATVKRYGGRGVEFGLHSSCYTRDDYLGALREEIQRFGDCFGFAPRSMTVHGLGEHRLETRERFSKEIVDRLTEFGFTFTDCDPRMRRYDYVITDCHPEPGSNRRYICDDMLNLPRFFQAGRDYLVLTHPCYWR